MFLPHKSDTGTHQPWEYLPAAAGTYQIGQALNMTGGKLVLIAEDTNELPSYICVANITVSENEPVPVQRVQQHTIYETELTAAAEGVGLGLHYAITAGGMGVHATEEETACFEVVEADSNAIGSTVRGRFVHPIMS